jgi:hypothetical protein
MEAECGPGGGDEKHLFIMIFFMQPCRVHMESTAAGVNTFAIRKIYLSCPGFGRHFNKSSNLSILLPCRSAESCAL